MLPNLTVTLGPRYDNDGGLYEKYGNLVNFDVTSNYLPSSGQQGSSDAFPVVGGSTFLEVSPCRKKAGRTG